MNTKKYQMILDWMRKIHQLEYAHRYQSIYYVNFEKFVGIGAFIATTLVAFSYRFPSVDNNVYNQLPFFLKHNFFVPIISTVAAILTGLQTFLKPSEKSETHKKTASYYEKLRHQIELMLTTEMAEEKLDNRLIEVKNEWDSLDSINVGNRFFLKGKKKVNSFKKYPKELSFIEDQN